MKINVIATETFEKDYKRLKRKYKSLENDLIQFQSELINNPALGKDLGHGVRKIRLAIKSKNKGKSGGARIITYNVIINVFEKNILLVTMYDKTEKETISDAEIKQIIKSNGF